MLSERVNRLRSFSVNTEPYISSERAELVTQYYQDNYGKLPMPLLRAGNFYHLMANKEIYIGDDELIVGERGPAPRAVPTYPELCCHDLADLEALHNRFKNPYRVSSAVREVYAATIIPYWLNSGMTMRKRVFNAMTPAWHAAFDAGVFTEFMEQRSPGHAICDDKIYKTGMLALKEKIAAVRARLNPAESEADLRGDIELQAMAVCADAIMLFAQRHAEKATELARVEKNDDRRQELYRIAEVCKRVPAQPPRNFHEAIQMYWFMHLGVITETNPWDSYNPGRLDRHLFPFYQADIDSGLITEEYAREMLQCFWVKFNNHPAPPKVGVTLEQSATYTDFSLINVGGLDSDGKDCVNPLSFMILDTVAQMQLTQPSCCIQLSKDNPDAFLRRASEVISLGMGQPSCFNTETIITEQLNHGKTLADARDGGPSGCVETSSFGKESCTLTGYMNWPKIIELVLNNGKDPASGLTIGIETGDPREFNSIEQFIEAYRRQLQYFIDVKIEGNNTIERLYAEHYPAPFMSLLVDDCIDKALDYHDGGPRYNMTYIQGVGLGVATDCISAIQTHIFEGSNWSMAQLLDALAHDFAGYETMRQTLLNKTPCYGNDDPAADRITRELFEIYYNSFNGRPNTKGGRYGVNLLPTTCHIYFGEVTGALPNGRLAHRPLSDGISPAQGADRHGPTAVIRSAACIDHCRTGGTLLNMKFSPQIFTEGNITKFMALIRSYFALGGHHIQFNIIDVETLRQAQAHPEDHRDLIVRVAGYSDYFTGLSQNLQEEIIARTQQSLS